MAEIKWSSQSQRDLSSIAEFIARDSKKYARITLDQIREQVQVLKTKPKFGRVVPEVRMETIREIIFKNYRIVYQIKSEYILIVTVHHSSMLFYPERIK